MNSSRLLAAAGAALMIGLASPALGQDPMPERTFPPQADETKRPVEVIKVPDWRGRARDMIATLSEYAHARAPAVTLLVRGGPDLLFNTPKDDALAALLAPPSSLEAAADGQPVGGMERQFARAIEGVVVDDLYCRDTGEDAPPPPLTDDQLGMLKDFGLAVVAIERCDDAVSAQQARAQAAEAGIIAHVTTDDRLASVPSGRLPGASAEMVQSIGAAETVLVALDTSRFASMGDWLTALENTNHDVLVITPFFRGDEALTPEQVYTLKFKKVGVPRLVIARLPMTEARDTAWYWKPTWKVGSPSFIKAPTAEPGVYRVDFAHPEWREIVGQTFKGLLDLGFDGVMLDGLDVVDELTAEGPVN